MHVLTFQGTAKMDKPIEMPFRGQTRGPKEPCIRWGSHAPAAPTGKYDGLICAAAVTWAVASSMSQLVCMVHTAPSL